MKLMKWHYSCFYNLVCFTCVVFHCIEGSEVNITLWPCVIIRQIVRGRAPEPDGPEFRNLHWPQNCSMLPTETEQPTRKWPDRSCLSFTRAHKLAQAQKQTLTLVLVLPLYRTSTSAVSHTLGGVTHGPRGCWVSALRFWSGHYIFIRMKRLIIIIWQSLTL